MVLGVEPVGAGTMLLCGLDPGFAPSGGRPILGFCFMPDGGVGRAGGRLLKDLKVSSSTSTADAAQSSFVGSESSGAVLSSPSRLPRLLMILVESAPSAACCQRPCRKA